MSAAGMFCILVLSYNFNSFRTDYEQNGWCSGAKFTFSCCANFLAGSYFVPPRL